MTVEEGRAVLEHMKKFNVRPMLYKGDYMYVNDVYDWYGYRWGREPEHYQI